MHYVIAYDIADDRLRARVAKTLARRGCWRLQKSVFLAPDFSPDELAALRAALRQLLLARHDPADSVLCLPIERDLLADNFWLPADTPPDALTQKVYKLLF